MLTGLVLLELVIVAGAWWLVSQVQSEAMQTSDPAAANPRITQTEGTRWG